MLKIVKRTVKKIRRRAESAPDTMVANFSDIPFKRVINNPRTLAINGDTTKATIVAMKARSAFIFNITLAIRATIETILHEEEKRIRYFH